MDILAVASIAVAPYSCMAVRCVKVSVHDNIMMHCFSDFQTNFLSSCSILKYFVLFTLSVFSMKLVILPWKFWGFGFPHLTTELFHHSENMLHDWSCWRFHKEWWMWCHSHIPLFFSSVCLQCIVCTFCY